jgi:hypothetical protein
MYAFIFAGLIPRNGIDGSCGNFMLLFKKLPDFSKVVAVFYISPAMYESSHFSTFLPTFVEWVER